MASINAVCGEIVRNLIFLGFNLAFLTYCSPKKNLPRFNYSDLPKVQAGDEAAKLVSKVFLCIQMKNICVSSSVL